MRTGEVFAGQGVPNSPPEYQLPALSYSYEALEPYIDKTTMMTHYEKHHSAYTKGLNTAVRAIADARDKGDYSNIQQLSRMLAFHLGGHLNHSIFWHIMAPKSNGGGGEPQGNLADAIKNEFGDFTRFKAHFSAAAKSVEGNGWCALVWHPAALRLMILTVMNHQDLIVLGSQPLLIIDVWEHAYYLKYRNRRDEYIEAWWNVVNWGNVGVRFSMAL
ncbi:MAG: superoxide dismutase [Deltaproteobacteria bacterium]|nr:superoxide dismutase [Deltaproteobacteria bacterium]